MSRMTLKKIEPNGDVVNAAEFRNSWLFQPFVWMMLCERYNIEGASMTGWPRLWEFAKNGEPLEWFEWNTLVFGYDYALVRADDFFTLSESLHEFNRAYGEKSPHNHCPALAEWLENADISVVGAGVYGTSVSDDQWIVRVGENDHRPYNVQCDTGHFFADLKQP